MPSRRYTSKRSFGTRFNDIKEGVEVSAKITPPDLISGDAITFSELDINAVDATVINYGGIQASNFSQGAKIPSGESNQRVPSDLDDVFYWEQVTSGLLELHKQGFHNDEDIQNVEATSEGIYFTPTATEPARIYLTGRLPIPKSRKVYATWEADRSTNLRLIWWKNSHPVDVTHSSTTAGVATITTATAHGFSVGSEIRVTGLDVDYNGYHTITAVGTYSISYASPTLDATEDLNEDKWEVVGKVNLEDYVYEELTDKVQWNANYRSANVSNKVLTSNIATLTTNASHEFVVGDTVKVSGIDSTFDGAYKITSVTDTTLSYQKEATNVTSTAVSPPVQITSNDSTSATEYAVYVEVPAGADTLLLKSAKVFEVLGYGAKAPLYANVNNSVLTSNEATLTTSAAHNFVIDSSVVVSNVGAPYDGTHIISNINTSSNTFSYKLINANITSAAADGKAVAYDGKQHSELTPDGLRLYQPDGTLAVDLTTAGSSVFNIYYGGDVVTSIDYEGKATFTSLDGDYFVKDGVDLVGTFANANYNGFPYSDLNTANVGAVETVNSYLNRLPRGTIYEGYFTPENLTLINTVSSYLAIASGMFTLEENRSYRIDPLHGSFNIDNNSNKNAIIYLVMGTGPHSLGGPLHYASRSIVASNTLGSVIMPSIYLDALSNGEAYARTITGARAESVPAKTGLVATLSTTTSNVTLTTGNTVNIISGQQLTKTSGTGVFGNGGVVYVGNVYSSTVFDVVDDFGFSTNHNTAGSITFSTANTTMISIRTNNAPAFYDYGYVVGVAGVNYPYAGYWELRDGGSHADGSGYIKYAATGIAYHSFDLGNVVSRSTTVNLTLGGSTVTVADTSGLYRGMKLNKTSGTGSFGTGAIIDTVTSGTTFTTTVTHSAAGAITFNVAQYETINSPVAKVYKDLDLATSTVEYGVPIYWTLMLAASPVSTSANANITLSTAGSPTKIAALTVIDEGPAKSPSFDEASDFDTISGVFRQKLGSQPLDFDTQAGPYSSTAPTGSGLLVTKTVTKNCDQSAYYDNYGRGTSTTSGEYAYRYSLYQGNPGTASGVKKSAVRFPDLNIPAGATVTKAELYLRNRHSYLASGLTVYIGAHLEGELEDQTTAPLGINFAGATDVLEVHFDKGQGKWVTLPSSWYSDIDTYSTFKGVLIGLSAATNTWYSGLTNYGYFDGNTMADEPRLRITYQYTEGA